MLAYARCAKRQRGCWAVIFGKVRFIYLSTKCRCHFLISCSFSMFMILAFWFVACAGIDMMAAIWDKISDTFLMILAYPIVMLYVYAYNDGGSSYVRDAEKKARQYEKAVRAAMVERRKCEPKALSKNQPGISTAPPQQTHPTTSRVFFSKPTSSKENIRQHVEESRLLSLPFELRQQIFEEVLGSSTLHITQHPHRLGHTRCTSSIPSSQRTHSKIICSRNCFNPNKTIQTYRYGEFLDHDNISEDSLSLLLVNRQLYHEASHILYESTTFDFNHPQSLTFFARSVRASRLNSIRSINITWSGVLPFLDNKPEKSPDDLDTWKQMWTIVAEQMKGLRKLRVRMLIFDDEREMLRSGPFLKYARKRWTVDGVQFEKLLTPCRDGVRDLEEFRLGVELPPMEEVVWDVEELERKIAKAVCRGACEAIEETVEVSKHETEPVVLSPPETC